MHHEQQVMEGRYNLPYNWLYQPSDRHWRGKNGLWTIASSLAGGLQGKTILDAGCGDGWYSARLIKVGATVSGVDLSERAIAFAKQILPAGKFTSGSLSHIPYADKTFNVVFSFQVLEHIPPEEFLAVIQELSRVLKDDGVLIVSVPSIRRPLSKAHFRHFTAESISEALAPAFTVEQVVGQEQSGFLLRCIEVILENRFWFLPALAEKFHRGWYIKNFNHLPADQGKNIIIKAKKSSIT